MKRITKYIKDNTSNKIDSKRTISNKYKFDIKIVSILLATSNLFGLVMVPNKVVKNEKAPVKLVTLDDTSREYRDNLSTLPSDSNDDIIARWANVFELDPEIVKDIIYTKTNYLVDEEVLNEYYDGYDEDHNFTRAIICFVKDIYSNPGDYGYKATEIKSNIDFETPLTPEEQVVILSDIFDVNPFIAESIMIVEWGHPYNRNKDTKNVFGWSGATKTPNRTVSMVIAISGLNTTYGITKESTKSDIDSMASTYCPPNADNWKSMVKYNYDLLADNGIFNDYSDTSDFAIMNFTYDEYEENKYHIDTYLEDNKKKGL